MPPAGFSAGHRDSNRPRREARSGVLSKNRHVSDSLDSGLPQAALALEAGRELDELEREFRARGWSWSNVERLEDCAQAQVAVVDSRWATPEQLRPFTAAPEHPAVIVLASFGSVRDALDSVRAGACDYLARPISVDQILFAIDRALAQRALRHENQVLRRSLEERVELGALSSKDERMRRVSEIVSSIADTRASVLIQGESGVGKSALARAIHARSSRAPKPFVVVDCGAIPGTLLESTLFGHVRGAFTGAQRDKPGMIEAADGGTLFLDEIGNAPLELQARLLRVVQERVFERVGETRTRSVDVRWIAATHRDLRAESRAGRFREDLFWRLNVVSIELPPLRERAGDIPLLAQAFLERFAAEHRRNVVGFEPAAARALAAYSWPGNVRELEHVLERAVLLARGPALSLADLGAEVARAAPAAPEHEPGAPRELRAALAAPERRLIEEALAACNGCRQDAARLLGINRTTLFNKMRRHGLADFPRTAHGAPRTARGA